MGINVVLFIKAISNVFDLFVFINTHYLQAFKRCLIVTCHPSHMQPLATTHEIFCSEKQRLSNRRHFILNQHFGKEYGLVFYHNKCAAVFSVLAFVSNSFIHDDNFLVW